MLAGLYRLQDTDVLFTLSDHSQYRCVTASKIYSTIAAAIFSAFTSSAAGLVEPLACQWLADKMAQFDLTNDLAKYLDRHLVFPLLEFLSHKQMYDENDIQKGKIDLLEKTNMVDFAMDIYKHLYNKEDVPQEMKERRTAVVAKLKTLQVRLNPFHFRSPDNKM